MLLPPKQPYHFQPSAILHPQPNTKNSSPFFPNEVFSTHPPGQPRPSILKVDDSSITGGTLEDIFFYPGLSAFVLSTEYFSSKLSGNTFFRGLIILDYHLPGWTDDIYQTSGVDCGQRSRVVLPLNRIVTPCKI